MWQNKYIMVRTYSAGVFVGDFESIEEDIIVLKNARRIWYWSGAASLSQLAVDGPSDPKNCKFPCPVDLIQLFNVIEIIEVTDIARRKIGNVKIWEF